MDVSVVSSSCCGLASLRSSDGVIRRREGLKTYLLTKTKILSISRSGPSAHPEVSNLATEARLQHNEHPVRTRASGAQAVRSVVDHFKVADSTRRRLTPPGLAMGCIKNFKTDWTDVNNGRLDAGEDKRRRKRTLVCSSEFQERIHKHSLNIYASPGHTRLGNAIRCVIICVWDENAEAGSATY
ncbi:hypothetical protein SCHPADRAFT_930518 [Schizopora paradoxa]|uniref:Uncharacterized protein n=1 Tax=Schizopora paradoxa TaxID=27342 RepID=A0A0H2RM04_9AGAM|nr:hypothetical protein SCHPADRAFT_930518 [Schizopora paradoxa]